ncbi:HAD family hydrolase [Streptomyces sp. 2RAF24]|uniref:HAD family hydrolase n=1 Tax=Streptomyces sp. 2RAF24 TaxID=3232997 RepID=UPI003F9A97AD
MVLVGAVVLTLAIGDHPDAIVIGLVVLVNTTVGVAREIRADDAVAALSALTAPHARVRRDGIVRDFAGRPAEADEVEPLSGVLTVSALCNDATLRPTDDRRPDGRWTALGDPMEAALLAAAAKTGCPEPAELSVTRPRIGEVPFDSLRRRMTTLHKTGGDEVLVCMKGAPEAVLDPAVLQDPPDMLAAAHQEAARLAAHGYRVLAVASGVRNDLPSPLTEAESGLALLGLVALSDPPKPHAAATLASCRAAGITPVLITGDHPATARAVASHVALLGDGAETEGHVVTGADVAAGRVADLTSVRVFARTDPQQKLDIVEAWRAGGAVPALLAAAALYVPFLNSILETEPLGCAGVGIALACAPAGFVTARVVRTAFHTASPTGRGGSSGLR